MNKQTLILTHPLTGNYGGLLQAYANFSTLKKLKINSYIYHYIPKDALAQKFSWIKYFASLLKYILNKQTNPIWRKLYIAKYFTKKIKFSSELSSLNNNMRFVVGSDQVWRAIYCRKMKTTKYFFLNFATKEQRNCSIAYAASFGTDEWEGTEEETAECAKLIKDFKAVSVREHSGVRICKEVFGVDAVQMPDPTLLLNQEDYNYLIKNWRTKKISNPFMAIYILDENEKNKMLAHSLCLESNLYPQHLTPHSGAKKLMDRLPLSVPQWLRFMRDCECVLTDSFHGCAFSIIFNKPFICLGNKSRGTARFDSLLNTFGLQERLVTNPTIGELLKLINTPIDWQKVNEIRKNEQLRALNFLRTNLI